MPAESVHRHVDSPEFDHDLGASREVRDVLLPFVEYLGAPAFVRTDSQRSAKMIEHDRRIRECFRERNHHRHLWMVLPRLEAETQLVHPGEALAKLRRLVQIRRWIGMRIPYVGARVEAAGVPDSAKARRSRRDMRLEHRYDRISQRQIREADDSCRYASVAVLPARALQIGR